MFKNKSVQETEANDEKERSSSTSLQTTGERNQRVTPRTHSPFSFMRRFSEEMERLFEDFGFGDWPRSVFS